MLVQLRSKVPDAISNAMLGKHPVEADAPVRLHGDATIFKPNGERLLVLRRGALSTSSLDGAYPFMHGLRSHLTHNRGLYAGEGWKTQEFADKREKIALNSVKEQSTRYQPIKADGTLSNTSYSYPVRSAVVGSFDRYPRIPFCRETAFSTKHPKEWAACRPFIQEVAAVFKGCVPDRYEAQLAAAKKTHPAYVIPGTPFTTLTVNNTVAGACHRDKGDCANGFGTMAVFRKGEYKGADIVFPAYGVSVDMQHGDIIFFDSHEIHGNIPFRETVGEEGEDWVRISMVMYFREKMLDCLSPAEELERAKQVRGGFDLSDDLPSGEGDD